jgi:hypothetical protein
LEADRKATAGHSTAFAAKNAAISDQEDRSLEMRVSELANCKQEAGSFIQNE